MSLFNKKKLEHKEKQVGKYVGAQTKLNNYEYGRNKAKSISKALKQAKNR